MKQAFRNTELAAKGETSFGYKDNPYFQKKWEDEDSNHFVMLEAMPELQALAGKALATVVTDGTLEKLLFSKFPYPISMNLNSGVDPENFNLYTYSDRQRQGVVARKFGSVSADLDYTVRKTSKGLTLGFQVSAEGYNIRSRGGLFGLENLYDNYILRQVPDLPRGTWSAVEPAQHKVAVALINWLEKTYPFGTATTLRVPLENILPNEFTEVVDGEPAYYLSLFREGSANLAIRVENFNPRETEVSLYKDTCAPDLAKRFSKEFANSRGHIRTIVSHKDIIYAGDNHSADSLREVFNGLKLTFYIEIDLNKEEAEYVTHGSNDVTEAADYLQAVVQQSGNGETAPWHWQPLDFESSVPARVGLGNTMVMPQDLQFIYVPPNDKTLVHQFKEAQKLAYVTSDGSYQRKKHPVQYTKEELDSLLDENGLPPRNLQLAVVPNQVIGTDWLANVMLYASSNRGISSLDVADFSPTRPFHVTRWFEEDLYRNDAKVPFFDSLNRAFRIAASNHQKVLSQNTIDFALHACGIHLLNLFSYNPEVMYNSHIDFVKRGNVADLEELYPIYGEIRRGEVDQSELAKLKNVRLDSELPFNVMYAMVINDFVAYADKGWKNVSTLLGEFVMTSRLQVIGAAMAWQAALGSKGSYNTIVAEAKAQTPGRQPEEWSQVKDYKNEPIPNLAEGMSVLPHQAKVMASLQKNMQFNLLSVDAGGGKTNLAITDILKKLEAGLTKVPAVFCPGHLLANYVQDADYFTGGKVNVIPLRTETYNRLGAEYFEKVAKGKPINTFFVIDYDFARQEYEEGYVGNQVVGYFPRAQWLRSLGIDAVWLDEGHYLKNDSARTRAMREALVDVKRVTLMTGTFYPTRAEDVVNQTMLWDSGLFGYPRTFREMFGVDEDGLLSNKGRQVINQVLNDNICIAKAKRKEWAALLPDRTTAFHFVELNKQARTVYEAILLATLEEIKKDPVVMRLLSKADELEESDEAALDSKLSQYLQRLEKAITCPYQDPLWQAEWGEVSPKVKMVEKIIKDHLAKGIKGKILIYCSYHSSVDAIYDNLSPDIQKITLRYSAETKEKDRARFENDKNIQVMIGIENSMNTGINAQFASRLIRVDSIYSPGQLEQGESRIGRPNLKVKEFRSHLYFDWVLAARSYDATKSARLISKLLDVEKFNNLGNPNYEGLAELPVLRLNFDVIANSSNFDEELAQYLGEYLKLENEVKVKEAKDYKRRNPVLTPIPLEAAPPLKGSKLMMHVPYIPLGGLPLDLGRNSTPFSELVEQARESGKSEDTLVGRTVHTEYGEGLVKRVNKDTARVEVPNVGTISLSQQTIYVINTPSTRSTKSIRQQLAAATGLKTFSFEAVDTSKQHSQEVEDDVGQEVEQEVVEEIKEARKESKQKRPPVPVDYQDGEVELYPSYLNEFYALAADEWTDWEEATGNDLADYGFKHVGASLYLELTRWQHCKNLREAWNKAGFLAPKSFYEALTYMEDAMKRKRADLLTFKHLQKNVKDLLVWNLDKRRKLKADRAKPYFAIQEGHVYVMIDINSTPAWAKIKGKVIVPGARWYKEEASRWFISTKRTDIVKTVKAMINDGVPLYDVEELKHAVTSMRNLIRKETD